MPKVFAVSTELLLDYSLSAVIEQGIGDVLAVETYLFHGVFRKHSLDTVPEHSDCSGTVDDVGSKQSAPICVGCERHDVLDQLSSLPLTDQ